jgi:hypothetical protein
VVRRRFPAIKSPLASIAVAIELVTVTVPEVPPPLIPVPAVTPVISPAVGSTQVKSKSVPEVLLKTWPVVPPNKSCKSVSTAWPKTSKSAGRSVTKLGIFWHLPVEIMLSG